MTARQPGNLEELPAQLAELRELIREGHGVTKDLRAAIKEAAALTRDMADACAKAAFDASSDEMNRWAAHVQQEMNDRARDLNRAVTAARDHIGRALLPKIASVDLSGDVPALTIQFEGNLFDADVPLPRTTRQLPMPDDAPTLASRYAALSAKQKRVHPRAAADKALASMDELVASVERLRARLTAEVREYDGEAAAARDQNGQAP